MKDDGVREIDPTYIARTFSKHILGSRIKVKFIYPTANGNAQPDNNTPMEFHRIKIEFTYRNQYGRTLSAFIFLASTTDTVHSTHGIKLFIHLNFVTIFSRTYARIT